MPPVKGLKPRNFTKEGSNLQQRNFLPDDVSLPNQPPPLMQQTRFRSQIRHDDLSVSVPATKVAAHAALALDGFRLLEACGVAFPDQAHAGDASGKGVASVVAEDLAFFPSLNTLDLGRNDLGDHAGALASLAGLPSLRVLKLPCNGIRNPLAGHPAKTTTVGDGGSGGGGSGHDALPGLAPVPRGLFCCLAVLDLSYNLVADPAAVAALGEALPHLRELDLTCNGLACLPPPRAMARFLRLTRLVLERNGLEDASGGGAWLPADEEAAVMANERGGGAGGADTPADTHADTHADTPAQQAHHLGGGHRRPPPPPAARKWSTLGSLAACPVLEDLQLGHNYLTKLPPSAAGHGTRGWRSASGSGGGGSGGDEGFGGGGGDHAGAFFPRLETLGLAYNYVAHEGELAGCALLGRLRTLTLYGNPLLGPSLEDPTGDSVSELAAAVFHARDGVSLVPLDVLTEVPRARHDPTKPLPDPSRRAAAAARRSHYRTVSLRPADLDEGPPLPSAQAFRAAGHALTVATNGAPGGALPHHPRRSVPAPKARHEQSPAGLLARGDDFGGDDDDDEEDGDRSWADAGSVTGTFLTGVDPYDKPYGAGGRAGQGGGRRAGTGGSAAGEVGMTNPHGPQAAMPPAIFAAALAKEATPDPGKLRSALEGLRTALRAAKQTNSGPERYLLAKTSEDPAERAAAAAMRRLDRPTQAARAKTLPRRLGPGGLFEAPPLAAEMGPGRAAGAGRGAPHDVSFKAVLGRQDAAARMLSSIEADLDAMVNRRGLQGE